MKKGDGIIPLNCVDKSLLAFENADQRMTYHGILSIEGEIDADRLNQALLFVLRFHPTLRTVVRTKPFRLFRQIQDASDRKILEVRDLVDLQLVKDLSDVEIDTEYERCLSEWINRPLDVGREFPFRVLLLRKRTAESSLIFTFHHFATDAIRAIHFVNEVLSRYNNETPNRYLLPEDIRIYHRGDELMELARYERPKTEGFYGKMLTYLFYYFLIHPFSHPSRIFHDGFEQSEEIHFCSGKINPTELQEMKSKSRSVKGTMNDILTAACFRTIEKWNRLHGKESKKISLMVPVNIGPKELQHITSNQISFLSLSSIPEDRADPARLLRKVVTRTASTINHNGLAVVRGGDAFSIVYFAHLLSRLPLAIMRAALKFILFPLHGDTVLLTNLGVIRPWGTRQKEIKGDSFKIVDITPVAQVFDFMGMSLCIGNYNSHLNVCLSYKTSHFSKEKAQEFLDSYLEEIKNYQVCAEAV
jgi:NRPS condensation-like uncharacterized protein